MPCLKISLGEAPRVLSLYEPNFYPIFQIPDRNEKQHISGNEMIDSIPLVTRIKALESFAHPFANNIHHFLVMAFDRAY
jgi:hypothetical protein